MRETGKGFPDTSLLKPLADTLGVSIGELLSAERIAPEQIREKTDTVIVKTMQTRRRPRPFEWALLVSAVLALCIGLFLLLRPATKPTALSTITAAPLDTRFPFAGEDPALKQPHSGLSLREYENAYEYYSPDAKERYLYKIEAGISEHPVLAFVSRFGSGSLWGIRIGDPIHGGAVPELGVPDYSLRDFLTQKGFLWAYATPYRDSNLVYLLGQRCYWYYYEMDNLFLNLLIRETDQVLLGYELGFIDSELTEILTSDHSQAYRGLWDTAEKLSFDTFSFLQVPAEGYKWYLFVAPETGRYRFYSETDCGTFGELFPAIAGWHSTENRLCWDDNSGKNGRDFLLEYDMTAGQTVYLRVRGDNWCKVDVSYLWAEKVS